MASARPVLAPLPDTKPAPSSVIEFVDRATLQKTLPDIGAPTLAPVASARAPRSRRHSASSIPTTALGLAPFAALGPSPPWSEPRRPRRNSASFSFRRSPSAEDGFPGSASHISTPGPIVAPPSFISDEFHLV